MRRAAIVCLLLLAFTAPAPAPASAQVGPTQADLTATGRSGDWPYASHDYSGRRFSDLSEITPENAGSIRLVCVYDVGDSSAFQPYPLVSQGTLYATSQRLTVAIDAANCRERWRQPVGVAKGLDSAVAVSLSALLPHRGAALKDGRLVRGTADGRLIALDAATGSAVWERQVADPARGELLSMPPLVYENLVLLGPGVGEAGVRGWVAAFSLADGSPVWRWNAVPDSGAPGSETWPNWEVAQRGGGAVWTPFVLDPDEGTVFVGTGNPVPDLAGYLRPGENLFTNSVVALDVRTGALRWYLHTGIHDVHDWDLTHPGPLFTLAGRAGRRVIAPTGKDGLLRIVDRQSHAQLTEVAVTTRLNPELPVTTDSVRACPGLLGGVEWNGPAFNPGTGLLYVPAVDWCGIYAAFDSSQLKPGDNFGGSFVFDSLNQSTGWLTALDPATGEVRWRYHSVAPMLAAVTTSAGGVLFTGEVGGNFLVMDARTGTVLSRLPTGGVLGGGVITYAVAGKQYVALTSGSLAGFWGRPSVPARILVFALP
jgi:alcohol dehydrogenase (cytochrome c)